MLDPHKKLIGAILGSALSWIQATFSSLLDILLTKDTSKPTNKDTNGHG